MINRELELTFAAAIKEAKQRRHEFFTLEHILYAILHDVTGRRILYHCGADLTSSKSAWKSTSMSVRKNCPKGRIRTRFRPWQFSAFYSGRSCTCRERRKRKLTRATSWRPCFSKRTPMRFIFSKSQGISRLDVLSYISHGISKVSDPEERNFSRLPLPRTSRTARPAPWRALRST